MWKVVYVAENKSIAEMLKDLLDKEGLLVMLRPVGIPHAGSSGSYEVLVPESEAEEASEVLVSFRAKR
ncbi:MAG TPA: glutamate decarboxylase [Clostridia bacterium]|nr:glutamate decarboxylase [Clostridia bacterium]